MPLSAEAWEHLVAHARRAAGRAYCPYSQFRVGAAVVADQTIFDGANVENASYGLTLCAERVAIFSAVAAGHPRIAGLVVYTPTPQPTAPCGACRQVLNEFAPDAELLCVCDGPAEIRTTLTALLPRAFGPQSL